MRKILLLISFAFVPFIGNSQCLVQVTQNNVTCFGACNGTASAFPIGVGPYTYTWMPGNMSTQNVTGLCAGIYTLSMFDAGFGCTATATVTITQPQILSLILNSTPASCPSCCDGTITATGGGGTAPFNYSWTPPVGTGNTATGLCVGTYSCCVTDANGCVMCSSLNVTFLTEVQNQVETGNLSVFPSPTSGLLTIDQTFENASIAEISLHNVLGQSVYSKCLESAISIHEAIDMSAFPNGIYFISIKTNSGTTTNRIVKE